MVSHALVSPSFSNRLVLPTIWILTIPTLFTARFLKADPTWIPLRDNPRFRTLLEAHMPSPV